MTQETKAEKKLWNLPAGWEQVLDKWSATGCKPKDPGMLALNRKIMNELSKLPERERPVLLRQWKRQVRERRKGANTTDLR